MSFPPLPFACRRNSVNERNRGKRGRISSRGGEYDDYQLPSLELLVPPKEQEGVTDERALAKIQQHIVETLSCFKVDVEPGILDGATFNWQIN